MADTRTRDLSMMPFALSTPQNDAGGGASQLSTLNQQLPSLPPSF